MKGALLVVGVFLGFAAARGLEPGRSESQRLQRERVRGIGAVFFKAQEPALLSAWYRDHLGLEGAAASPGQPGMTFVEWREKADPQKIGRTLLTPLPRNTRYLEPGQSPFMISYRVQNLDRFLRQLRGEGIAIDARIVKEKNGRYAWIADPEGNRVELWEPAEGS